jgi:hypothetical protein
MFIIGQSRIFHYYFVLLLTLFLIPQTICAEEITLQLPGGVPITLIKVPAGTFLMGSPEGERGNNLGNETQHQVTLTRDYYLGKTEVTHRQWEAVMGAPVPWPSDCALADGGIPESSSETAIYCVSWNSINGSGGFIERLNSTLETDVFRLPSEAEWERAAPGDQGFLLTVFPNRKEMFLAWFTYDTERPPEDVTAILGEPGHRWLTAQGPYEGDTANLTIFVTEGGVFDAAEPAASTDLDGDGTLTIEFADCTEGLVRYEITSLGISGEIPIQRIAPDNISLCESLNTN